MAIFSRLLLLTLVLVSAAPAAEARVAAKPWPPATGPGVLFAHYGEEHWNDADGGVVLPKVVEEVVRYRPALVTMSGDKTDDGTTENLTPWRDIMAAYDRAGIPYMAGVGNHDGKQQTPEAITDLSSGSTPLRDITFYKQVFAGRPYPMGDAKPYDDPSMGPRERPADDPEGASTHFYVDYGPVRWVFIDNSCFGIVNCDPLQNPPDGRGRSQFEFLADAAREAGDRLVFVVMHMPTRDPRDQSNSYYTSLNHNMGKGASPDNERFEEEAEALGVDGVFVGHIKGTFQYRGRGDIGYYVDGGAGGELYTSGPLGVDHGYWYSFRLLRVVGKRVEHDMVPVITRDGIKIEGDSSLESGRTVTYSAFAAQPASKSSRAVVTRLELRDPAPIPRSGASLPWRVAPYTTPLLLLLLLPLLRRRRLVAVPVAVAVLGFGGVAMAQQDAPDDTPRENLPNPARMWTTSNPRVIEPVASETDDPRRDAATQTADGRFRAACPGIATLRITSGFEESALAVRVASRPGRILRTVRRGRGRALVRVRLAQPGVVRVGFRGRKVFHGCLPAGRHSLGRRGARHRPGTVVVRVHSDRPPAVRRLRLR